MYFPVCILWKVRKVIALLKSDRFALLDQSNCLVWLSSNQNRSNHFLFLDKRYGVQYISCSVLQWWVRMTISRDTVFSTFLVAFYSDEWEWLLSRIGLFVEKIRIGLKDRNCQLVTSRFTEAHKRKCQHIASLFTGAHVREKSEAKLLVVSGDNKTGRFTLIVREASGNIRLD